MSVLIFDADDTLWENNIYFESAFDDFCEFLSHSKLTPPQVRDVLNEIELANSKIHGYGARNFGRNLQQAYRHLAEKHIQEDDLQHVMSLAERILESPLELIPGVEETLVELSSRHHLALFTKGHPEEQKLKVERSGLERLFRRTEIVKEKDCAAYLQLVNGNSFPIEETWMIGNSPKSDINPALEAGIGAVLVPHLRTWVLERQEVRVAAGSRFLEVQKFTDLRRHF